MLTIIRYIPGKENVLSNVILRTIKKEEFLIVVNCYSLQLDICSYGKNDLCVKQLNDSESSLVIDYWKVRQNSNQCYLHYLKDLNHNCI